MIEALATWMMVTAGTQVGTINGYRDMCPGYELSAKDLDAINTLMENLFVNEAFTVAHNKAIMAVVDVDKWLANDGSGCPLWSKS